MIRKLAAGLVLLLSGSELASQSAGHPGILPRPTGGFGIGRVTYHWVDSSRAKFLDARAAPRRELMVDVWYPAGRGIGGPRAAYLPGIACVRHALGDSVLRRQFAPAYAAVASGLLQTHASEGAAATCPANGCPVLIFSHGGGVDRSFYTSQYEDLASHGYVVAAIAHAYDTHLVVFPDGRAVGAAPAFRDTLPVDTALSLWRRELERELRDQAQVRRLIGVEAADIRFVIDQLAHYARDARRRAPLARKLDLTRIGAFGHSAGGEAAALACQVDARLEACLNQDGVMNNLPFVRDASGRTMNQPFMYIGRIADSRKPQLSDQELASMEMTRAELDSLFRALAAGQDDLLSDIPGGAYRVRLEVPGVTHMSFSDEPLVEGAGDSVKTANARLALAMIRTYTRAFFDKSLLGRTETPLDRAVAFDSAFVAVERFGRPAARPRQ